MALHSGGVADLPNSVSRMFFDKSVFDFPILIFGTLLLILRIRSAITFLGPPMLPAGFEGFLVKSVAQHLLCGPYDPV